MRHALCAASLLLLGACRTFAPGGRTTSAFDEQPPGSIGVATPWDRTRTPGAPKIVRSLWETMLERRGWTVVSPGSADAVLKSTITVWNWQSGSDVAWVTIEARLERRSDGTLLWRDTGRGCESDSADQDDRSRGLTDSLYDWAFDEAWEGLVERPLDISTRADDLRAAARDSVATALRTLPDGPGR